MKKTLLKSTYKLKIYKDGSSAYSWVHPWKGWLPLVDKDYYYHHKWNYNYEDKNQKMKVSYYDKYKKSYSKT